MTDASASQLPAVAKFGRNVKRPRPLKINPPMVAQMSDEAVSLVREVEGLLGARAYAGPDAEHCGKRIARLNQVLAEVGASVEFSNKLLMIELDTAMRVACRDPGLDLASRLHILHLIEMRQLDWKPDENINTYYRQRFTELETNRRGAGGDSSRASSSSTAPPPTTPVVVDGPADPNGNAIPAPGGSVPPVKMGGDCLTPPITEEIVTNNNVNNKVNNNENDNCLDVRNNNNPDTDDKNSVLDSRASLPPEGAKDGKFSVVLGVREKELVISGGCELMVKTAREVLMDFFQLCEKDGSLPQDESTSGKPQITYDREELLLMAKSPLCHGPPAAWPDILSNHPNIVKREGPTSKHFLREMAEIRRQEEAKNM